MSSLRNIGTLGALALAATGAFATPIYNASGFTAADKTINFTEVSVTNNSAVTNQFLAYGVQFGKAGGASPWKMTTSTTVTGTGFSGKFITSTGATNNNSTNYLSIQFTNDVDAAGAYFEFNNEDPLIKISAFNNNNFVESLNYTNNNCCATSAFLGFNNIVFDELRISNLKDRIVYLDTLKFSGVNAVPEPASMALAGLVMGGLFTTRKRWIR